MQWVAAIQQMQQSVSVAPTTAIEGKVLRAARPLHEIEGKVLRAARPLHHPQRQQPPSPLISATERNGDDQQLQQQRRPPAQRMLKLRLPSPDVQLDQYVKLTEHIRIYSLQDAGHSEVNGFRIQCPVQHRRALDDFLTQFQDYVDRATKKGAASACRWL